MPTQGPRPPRRPDDDDALSWRDLDLEDEAPLPDDDLGTSLPHPPHHAPKAPRRFRRRFPDE
jgi:hypothetical protein